jgi:hypothetical protein
VAEVHIYYSVDPDPRARFWRSAQTTQAGDKLWTGKLPILCGDQPLFAFANVVYKLNRSDSEPYARPTERFALSSLLHLVSPEEAARNGASATDEVDPVIDDFSHGWQDWYRLEAGNPHHWEFSTRKLTDPKWQGQTGQLLTLDVQADKPNELVIVLTENFFRQYRGKQRELAAVVKLSGGRDMQTVKLDPKDFTTIDGEALSSWKHVDLLSLRPYYEKGDKLLGGKSWSGPQPVFRKLWWHPTETSRH